MGNKYTWLEDEQAYSVSDDSDFFTIGYYHIDIPNEFNGCLTIRINSGAYRGINLTESNK